MRLGAEGTRISWRGGRAKDGIAEMVSMRALECLATIVEQGSLTRAAAVLHTSQPALSHQIAAIERELSTPVIERWPRGIRPTAAGRGVALPRPTLRADSPRTAADLAAAGLGVALVPFSAVTPRPCATIRSLDPPELRDVVVIVAAPHDDLLGRFVGDLKRRGLPNARIADLNHPGRTSAPTILGVRQPRPVRR